MDDDGDGLIDCEDDDCQSNAISITPTTTADCTQDGSGAIELQVNGGMTPYSYQWADIAAPTAYWNFDNSTNDISEGNHHHHNLSDHRHRRRYHCYKVQDNGIDQQLLDY